MFSHSVVFQIDRINVTWGAGCSFPPFPKESVHFEINNPLARYLYLDIFRFRSDAEGFESLHPFLGDCFRNAEIEPAPGPIRALRQGSETGQIRIIPFRSFCPVSNPVQILGQHHHRQNFETQSLSLAAISIPESAQMFLGGGTFPSRARFAPKTLQ